VSAAGGGSADEQGQAEALALHFAGDVNHLIERWGDEATEPNNIGFLGSGTLENFLGGHHDTHIDDFVVIAGKNHTDNVLADVMDIAFDGGENNLALRLNYMTGLSQSSLFRFHERADFTT
jgi:hypothetical protein